MPFCISAGSGYSQAPVVHALLAQALLAMATIIPAPTAPTCPKCRIKMRLARIEPSDKPDHDQRTFECATCEQTETRVFKFK